METEFDIVIIGAGIHGAGIAQAAAAAGYRSLVLEQNGIASGTSCRSSKLIHGGLRYLESGQFGLVRESLYERNLLLQNAPGLVHMLPLHIPIFSETRRSGWKIFAGLSLYRLLGGSGFNKVAKKEWDTLDGLRQQQLRSVYCYADAQTDDSALTQAVMQSAVDLGAELLCPAQFLGAERSPQGYKVHYQQHSEQRVDCRVLVNAAGPWVNRVLAQIHPVISPLEIELVQGSHIVVAGEMERGAYYVEAPQDGRAVFILPWQQQTLVGTTENRYQGDPAEVQPLTAEIEYLQQVLQHYFPQRDATVLQSFAGLRVLPIGTSRVFHRSREILFQLDNPEQPHCLSIYGGKLTGYRATAEKVIRIITASLPKRDAIADTTELKLVQA